jgi:hypothetical protein
MHQQRAIGVESCAIETSIRWRKRRLGRAVVGRTQRTFHRDAQDAAETTESTDFT